MRYEGDIYRPPSEADAYILQATIGCSWNHCTYCDMYRAKSFRVRALADTLEDIRTASARYGERVEKVFVADGDALMMELPQWRAILDACRDAFPRLRRVSCYATAMNIQEKAPDALKALKEAGLTLLYVGPETGDDVTFKKIAKGANFEDHAAAAKRAHAAGLKLSAIFLLGAGGVARSDEHAHASAELITAMDPAFVSMLTLKVLPGTPIAKLAAKGRFTMPSEARMLEELRTMVAEAAPTDALFRTNHASNALPLAGRLPHDRDRIVAAIDGALSGEIALRPKWLRGL